MNVVLALCVLTLLPCPQKSVNPIPNPTGQLVDGWFHQTARGLIACWEKVGRLSRGYDEEGTCGKGSIWRMASQNPTITTSVIQHRHEGDYRHSFGDDMRGFAYFEHVQPDGTVEKCHLEFEFSPTDEDASVEVYEGVQCRPIQQTASMKQAKRFEKMMQRIWYISEADHYWRAFTLEMDPQSDLTIESFRTAMQLPPDIEIVMRDVAGPDELWEYNTDQQIHPADHWKAYSKLRETMEDDLTDIRMFQIQPTALGNFPVFLVGRNKAGDIVGLTSISAQT